MSRKSAQPDGKGKKDKKGKKGRRGKKGAEVTTIIIEEKPDVPPFGISVLFATVLSIPAIIKYTDGSMAFDAMILRYLAALVISWALVNLVYGVAKSFRVTNETTVEATTIDHVTGEMLEDNYRMPDSGYMPPHERGQAQGN